MIEIRSYRSVFDLERRIYRVDRLRLNPGGVPVRGILYFLAILSVVLIVGRMPLLRVTTSILPWYLRDLALPALSAALLTLIRVEGRPFHLAAYALARYRLGPRWLAGLRRCAAPGGRWRMEDIVVLPDGSDGGLRRLRYIGPGAVHVAVAHTRTGGRRRGARGRGTRLVLRPLKDGCAPSQGHVIALERRARLLVRAGMGSGREQ